MCVPPSFLIHPWSGSCGARKGFTDLGFYLKDM